MYVSNGTFFACTQAYKNWLRTHTHTHTNSLHAMARLDDSRKRTVSRKVKLRIKVLRSVVRSQLSEGVQKKVAWSSLPWVQDHFYFSGLQYQQPGLYYARKQLNPGPLIALPWHNQTGCTLEVALLTVSRPKVPTGVSYNICCAIHLSH